MYTIVRLSYVDGVGEIIDMPVMTIISSTDKKVIHDIMREHVIERLNSNEFGTVYVCNEPLFGGNGKHMLEVITLGDTNNG